MYFYSQYLSDVVALLWSNSVQMKYHSGASGSQKVGKYTPAPTAKMVKVAQPIQSNEECGPIQSNEECAPVFAQLVGFARDI